MLADVSVVALSLADAVAASVEAAVGLRVGRGCGVGMMAAVVMRRALRPWRSTSRRPWFVGCDEDGSPEVPCSDWLSSLSRLWMSSGEPGVALADEAAVGSVLPVVSKLCPALNWVRAARNDEAICVALVGSMPGLAAAAVVADGAGKA